MCGFCGVVYFDDRQPDPAILARMNATLTHRGPDQGRELVMGACGLANRRLAILDLSPAGALPMQTPDGALTLAYNGEVYNFPDLRARLEADGIPFQTGTDTEVILALYREAGPDVVKHLRGMFGLALWDADRQRLLLARDRMGQKPLYYYRDAHVLVFASEIKALLEHPDVPRRSALTPDRLALYLSYGYVPTPDTAFEDIHMLPPGYRVIVDRDGTQFAPEPYWEPPYPAPAGGSRTGNEAEAVREALAEAVRLRLISDVPLGAFLSGGLDSSLIAALMRQSTNATVRTFSIGFAGDDSFDETPYAQQVADLLGTEHTAFTVEPDALGLLPKLVWHHDQPFADSSAIPTFLVSELTRQHVTVALTGDGGDELFAGYERFYAAALTRRLGAIPRLVWGTLARGIGALPEGTGYYNVIKRAGRFARGASLPLDLAYFDWIRLFSADAIHALTGQADGAARHFAAQFSRAVDGPGLLDVNMRTYLPDDLLIKADRTSMAASLEARAPFLDHMLVELAAALPYDLKLNGRVTKHILKEAARGLLPDAIIDRPKHGFGVPLGAWLRADSAPVRDVLLSPEARGRGLLNMGAVETLLDEHTSGQRDHGQRLWTLLTLEWWHRLFIDPPKVIQP